MTQPLYQITTWDSDRQEFTPHKGVPSHGLTLFQLRMSMRLLQQEGYDCYRNKEGWIDPSVMVQRMVGHPSHMNGNQ